MNMTNERLKEIAESHPRLGLTETEWKSIAAELLRWRETRAMRDVGDEEIRELNHNLLKRRCPSVWVCRLRDIAIARGQTRTDAVNKAAEWAKECEKLEAEIERLEGYLTIKPGQFFGEDNSDPPQLWVWEGARSEFESAEPLRRIPITRLIEN